MGTWIEMRYYADAENCRRSRSLRGNVDRNRYYACGEYGDNTVVPYVGTWIEMIIIVLSSIIFMVVPYVGTWIEIDWKRWNS